MSDNEYERFEVTDYDLENEFNPNRPRKKLTKHQQIYGIWADDSDNEEDERRQREDRSGFGGSANLRSRRSKDYTAPVSFVAGGIQQSGKRKETDREEDEGNDAISDEDDNIEERQQANIKNSSDDDSEERSDDSDNEIKSKKAKVTKVTATAKIAHYNGNVKVGAWEQHTRGIGAKLLLQMGYKPGKGLGKDLQGIAQPVEAHIRKGRGAIGAYGPETSANSMTDIQQQQFETTRAVKDSKEKLNKWKKTEKANKKYSYRTVDEVLEQGKKSNFIFSDKISKKLGNVPVIDMTGPEKRVLSGYHALSSNKVQDEDLYDVSGETHKKSSNATTVYPGFALPELMHNLSLIVNMCEQDILTLDTTERTSVERQVALQQGQKQLEEIIKLEENHISTLEQTLKLVHELTANDGQLTLQRAENIFLELQQNYTAEYKEFSLGDLAAGVIAPLVKSTLSEWQPLEQSTQHVDLIKKWRSILENHADPQTVNHSNIFDPYSSLIWAGVVPSFRACAEGWDPKNHRAMATLLDYWAPLFPSWILDSVLEQLVLPRLCSGVRLWDPLTDTVPIHIWILPWNTVLSNKMEETIFPIIRQKLGNALQAWMPQDRSARAMLTPWKEAFDQQQMEIFLIQHIIPKLQMVLSEFIINPLQQDLEPWNQVWEWHELIPTVQMARLLDKHFFPKWMQVMVMWLNQTPDYIEISRWYTGWKSMLSEEILSEPNIKEHFRRALEIMQRATDTIINPTITIENDASTSLPIPPPKHQPSIAPKVFADLNLNASSTQLEFKELVSRKCAERGILFAPIPGRREFGKQVYRAGKLYCYIDRNVCMLSDSSFKNWLPTPLQTVLERAVTGNI